MLSFGDEAEEDEEEITVVSKVQVDLNAAFLMIILLLVAFLQDKKIKSSHDVLTEDPKLSSQPALDAEELRYSTYYKNLQIVRTNSKSVQLKQSDCWIP